MNSPRLRTPASVMLLFGVLLGWILASLRPGPVRAGASDRSGDNIVVTGPVLVGYDEGSRSPIPLEALYFLDYRAARLLATVPSFRQANGASHMIDGFAERDLAADFKIDPDVGPRPRFLMTTGSLGTFPGWAPLYVFETTTSQVAIYRMQTTQTIGKASRPRFELLELRSYATPEVAPAR
jgi:hypothetical protein